MFRTMIRCSIPLVCERMDDPYVPDQAPRRRSAHILPACVYPVCVCQNKIHADAAEVPEDILQEIPAQIRDVLDLAYAELLDVNGQELKTKNKYTKWRNNYEWGWCGGFITWCMLEKEIPMFDQGKAPKEEVPGLIHMKAAGVGKIYTGYERMNRITNIPQKGFIAVFGNANSKYVKAGSTPYYHVGLVYDVIQLPNGLYRITTIEGNVSVNFTDTDGVRRSRGGTDPGRKHYLFL